MNDPLLLDFNSLIQPVQPSPRKPRRKPMKKAKRAAPAPKLPKRVPKKRRVRKAIVERTAFRLPPKPVLAVAPKMSVLDFVRQVIGVEMQPWQERMLVALTQDDK